MENYPHRHKIITHSAHNFAGLSIEKIKKSYYKKGLENCDLVVYTNAVPLNDKNLIEAKKLNKPIV